MIVMISTRLIFMTDRLLLETKTPI